MNKPSVVLSIAGLSAILSLLVAGCVTYRVVNRTPTGGEIAMAGFMRNADDSAVQYMNSQCPNGYDVVEEGEAVVGQETKAETTSSKTIDGRPSTETTSSTTDKREWRIRYQCKGKTSSVQQVLVRF